MKKNTCPNCGAWVYDYCENRSCALQRQRETFGYTLKELNELRIPTLKRKSAVRLYNFSLHYRKLLGKQYFGSAPLIKPSPN